MRDFSKFEKTLIEKLVSLDHENSNIADFIVKNVLTNRAIFFQDNKLIIHYMGIRGQNFLLLK